ncbi:hypothetical protein KUTeg_004946 [Tegillarca granosa]|uniref:Transferrin-like domain-containing protein n=1 Tax=Tegillarca granosa TaxID=220873 RepID=A0ABQ9FKE9_TEGGR|nr:hypothetical protein KUTeg_004946 [Tegillarca granosa]
MTSQYNKCLFISARRARWCCVTKAELRKCEDWHMALNQLRAEKVQNYQVIPEVFECVMGKDVFDCMEKIQTDEADIMALDTGQGYFAGRYHNMMPILAEKYVLGIGTAAGWLYPIGTLLTQTKIPISECNAVVKSVTQFFSRMCLPGALNSFYNPFGNNPTSICDLCTGIGEQKCSSSDPHAGYDGAFRCLKAQVGDIAFLRHDTVESMLTNSSAGSPSEYSLLCPDGSRRSVNEYAQCNFGSVPSHMIMTSGLKAAAVVQSYKDFLLQTVQWFGPTGIYVSRFPMFSSTKWDYFGRNNLLFTDTTKALYDVGGKNTYYNWVDEAFNDMVNSLNYCPLKYARWCVISGAEKNKCEMMMMAFKARDLQPTLDCVLGANVQNCMKMIQDGDADLMALDAGDVYLAGRKFGLKPFASEDYGNMNSSFHVVAVARKRDSEMTLFNLKQRRACLAGIGRGDGWIVPVNIFIETEQFLPQHCTVFENLGQLFVRSCIPGAMDSEYNPNQYPVNLCEACAAGGSRKCRRNSDEQYYGAAGAFRCLVEKGGDIAFLRHLTVRDNTDGRNRAIWARNRRSDDYELMCKDGRRTNIDDWRNCHLGKVPANAVVTAKYKSAKDVNIFWHLLNFGQQFFSSDIEGDFHMFDSTPWYGDLMFTDDAVRLIRIPESKQTYKDYLGADFVGQVENLHQYTCVPVSSANTLKLSFIYLIALFIIIKILC